MTETEMNKPPTTPILRLDMDDNDEHRRQISLLLWQIFSSLGVKA